MNLLFLSVPPDPCYSANPCLNGGVCSVDTTGQYAVCQCAVGFVGSDCGLISEYILMPLPPKGARDIILKFILMQNK